MIQDERLLDFWKSPTLQLASLPCAMTAIRSDGQVDPKSSKKKLRNADRSAAGVRVGAPSDGRRIAAPKADLPNVGLEPGPALPAPQAAMTAPVSEPTHQRRLRFAPYRPSWRLAMCGGMRFRAQRGRFRWRAVRLIGATSACSSDASHCPS
jgi:hypothetical protein